MKVNANDAQHALHVKALTLKRDLVKINQFSADHYARMMVGYGMSAYHMRMLEMRFMGIVNIIRKYKNSKRKKQLQTS